MAAIYDQSGIRFLYPENWSVTQDQHHDLPRSVMIESPNGAFWSVDVHPFSVRPEELIENAIATLREEYQELEAEAVEEVVGGSEAIGYDVNFWYLDFVIESRLRSFRFGHATYMLIYQAEMRDFQQLEMVFRAITESMLREATTADNP